MRIAISGTHSVGKSTFVNDFLAKHPDYAYEQEPYRALKDKHEILFGDHQTQQHINIQLDYCLASVSRYQPGAKVIFDRAPFDYIPYSAYTAEHAHTDIDQSYVHSLYRRMTPALKHLDLIVFVPISTEYKIDLEHDGHRPTDDFYRDAADAAFKKFYREEWQHVVGQQKAPIVIEITGTREARINALEQAIKELAHE